MVPGEDPTAALRRQLEHFAESGGMFYDLSDLSARGIPTISVVFGSSTAGGAYQPGLSDYTIFVEGSAKVFLGGPPLVRMATGELATDEELGGARMHADVSGLADYLATSEADGIRMAREIVDHLEWRPRCDLRVEPDPAPPRYDPDELLGLIPVDLRGPVEIREVIARIVDDSRFEEFKARYGSTLVTGCAQIVGMPVGILANNGVLLADSAAKGAQFIQLCNQIGVPIVFLQHITGFMVGRDYERSGIIKQGSALIKAVSNSAVPHVTVILGASYGAGNYAMAGRAFGTRFVFAWPTARIAIMGPAQMAGVMSLVRAQQAARRGIPLDEDAEAAARTAVEALADAQSRVLYATGRVAGDGIIDPRDTRWVLAMALSATRYAPIRGADSFGVFRL